MRKILRFSVPVLSVCLLAAGMFFAGGAVAEAGVFGTCSAQGDFAICSASGIVNNPVTLTVTVTSSPDQGIYFSYDDTCSYGNGAGGKSGGFNATTPVTVTIPHPYSHPDQCVVAAGAQLNDGGTLHVSISNSTSAPVPAATHTVIGFAGVCLIAAGDSSALRTKVEIGSCSGGAASNWSFSHGLLKHGGLCVNAKGTASSGSPVMLYTCTGSKNELWSHNTAREYVLALHGGTLCLTIPRDSTTRGTQLVVARCAVQGGQRWSLPS